MACNDQHDEGAASDSLDMMKFFMCVYMGHVCTHARATCLKIVAGRKLHWHINRYTPYIHQPSYSLYGCHWRKSCSASMHASVHTFGTCLKADHTHNWFFKCVFDQIRVIRVSGNFKQHTIIECGVKAASDQHLADCRARVFRKGLLRLKWVSVLPLQLQLHAAAAVLHVQYYRLVFTDNFYFSYVEHYTGEFGTRLHAYQTQAVPPWHGHRVVRHGWC
jgi:hypothetical protein